MEKQNWKVGKNGGCIVSDVRPNRPTYKNRDFETEKEYYGGYLIAESIPDNEIEKLLAVAPEMFEVLETIENDNNQVPDWLWKRIKAVIKKVK